MVEEKKIIEALETLKKLCEESEDCSKCPVGTNDECCMIKDMDIWPEDYKIRSSRLLLN